MTADPQDPSPQDGVTEQEPVTPDPPQPPTSVEAPDISFASSDAGQAEAAKPSGDEDVNPEAAAPEPPD